MLQEEDAANLSRFIEVSKAKGVSDDFLVSLLEHRGWPRDDVYTALSKYWEQTTGLPIPERSSGGESSRDAFLYLLSFSTLAIWSCALGSILFLFIDYWLPDPVAGEYGFNLRSTITWQMASIGVAFPVFLIVMRTILREAGTHPERLQSAVRKWLTYIALLVTAGTMIGDLIWFLNFFLSGELTGRFLLKALVVMAICGAIFAYYLSSLRWDRNTNVAAARRRSLVFGVGAVVVVAATFCVGLMVAGTPSTQRRLEADEKRVQNLSAIHVAIENWSRQHRLGKADGTNGLLLPRTLNELAVSRAIRPDDIFDPETRMPYEYVPKSNSVYQLCATFTAPSRNDALSASSFWSHGRGRTCYTLDAAELTPLQ